MSSNPSHDNKPKEDFFSLAKANGKDTIAYILMIVGIILTLFQSFWGGFIVGAVLGYFYKSEIIQAVTNYHRIIDQEGLVKSIIIGGTLLALFIGSYPLFIGAAIVVLLYYVIGKDLNPKG